VRLLLDAMYAPVIADQLRRRAHDVVSAHERDRLEEASDEALLAIATSERRAIVTENIHDFMDLDAEYRQAGRQHCGIILTTNKGYSRHPSGGVGQLVTALDAWLRDHPEEATEDSTIWWL
jgi:predicted nuclease of predicted toxin-antitoxin system